MGKFPSMRESIHALMNGYEGPAIAELDVIPELDFLRYVSFVDVHKYDFFHW